MNAKEFADLLIKNDLATEDELRGCSEEEIEKLEKHTRAKLPQSYHDFLALMGHDAGIYRTGSDYLYNYLFDLTVWARETMLNGPFELPDDAFVILSHQGYIFAYFKISDGDDPPVYSYMEDELVPKKWASSFSEYLAKSLEEEVSALNKNSAESRQEYIQYVRDKKHGRV